MKTCLTIIFVLSVAFLHAQPEKKSVVVGTMTSRPNALLIVNPQNSDQGVLLPQLTTQQRTNLVPSSPTEDGLIVFDTGDQSFYYWNKGAWVRINADKDRHIRFQNIDPAAFSELKADDMRHTHAIMFESDNTFITVTRDSPQEIIAPVNIPHGAVVKELVVYYMDNDQRDINVRFARKQFAGQSEDILSWTSSGSSDAVRANTFSNFNGMEAVDLEKYSYRVIIRFDLERDEDVETPAQAKQRIYGVRIKYEQ